MDEEEKGGNEISEKCKLLINDKVFRNDKNVETAGGVDRIMVNRS